MVLNEVSSNVPPTPEELDGVKMIQHLQKMAGIDEPLEVALNNWRKFSEHDREQTRLAYNFFRKTRN